MFLRFIQWVCRFLLFIAGSTKFVGLENLPEKGPYIVAVNHMSASDLPLLYAALPTDQLDQLRFFAAEKWENTFLIGPIMAKAGAIYINRGAVDRKALRQAMDAVKEGAIFGLAPEGTRSRISEMIEAKDGAAYLASRAKVPIVPVGLINTDRWADNFSHLRRTHFELHVGKPFCLPEIGRRPKGSDLAAYTKLVMAEIAVLIPERYYGFYKDSPATAARLRGEDPWPYCQETLPETLVEESETVAQLVDHAAAS